MTLSIIAARAANGAIGKDNRLLWHLKDDLLRFKTMTMGRSLVMGRKTFESLPGLLPGRIHYVLSKNPHYQVPHGVRLFSSAAELMNSLPEGENFVIGGACIYQIFLPYADRLYLTEVEKSFDGDAFFPEFAVNEWVQTEKLQGEANILPHYFVTYERKRT